METLRLLQAIGIANSGNISQALSAADADQNLSQEQKQAVADFATSPTGGAALYQQAEAARILLIAQLS
jgi:hypothetical protein